MGCHDEGGFLTLDQADMGIWSFAEQMLTEKALIEYPVTLQQPTTHEGGVCPTLKAVSMTIHAVLHDMPSMHLLLLIYLPEDDISLSCSTNQIVIKDPLNLFRRELKLLSQLRREPLPKSALW